MNEDSRFLERILPEIKEGVGGDAGAAVQVHQLNPSLSGALHCLPCSKFLRHVYPVLTYCFPGSVFHILNLLFVKFLYFLHHEPVGLFLLLPPSCTQLRRFPPPCQRMRSQGCSPHGSHRHLRAAACFLGWQSLFVFSGALVSCFRSGCNPNLCRDPILRLVRMLTSQRQLCSSCDGSDSSACGESYVSLLKTRDILASSRLLPF